MSEELDTQTEESTETDTIQDEGTTTETEQEFSVDGLLEEVKKLRKEAANYRVKAKETEESKVEVESKLNEALNQHKSLQAEINNLQIETQLAGKVVDTKKALKLVDESYFSEDNTFLVDKFLTENEFLAPQKPVNNTPLNKGTGKPAEVNYTVDNWFDQIKK